MRWPGRTFGGRPLVGVLSALLPVALLVATLASWPVSGPDGRSVVAAPGSPSVVDEGAPGRASRARIVDPLSGRLCPPIRRVAFEPISGGCQRKLQGRMRMAANTAVGRMPLQRCELSAGLHIGGGGDVWLTRLLIKGDSPCADFRPCFDLPYDRALGGRIDAARSAWPVYTIAVCLDTCVGRFAGPLELPLVRRGDRWRSVLDIVPLGVSGLELDGELHVAGPELSIRPAR